MTQFAIEHATRQAWPALVEQSLPYGVLRYAHGVSRRSNSLNVFVNQVTDPERVRADTEGFFTGRGLPAIVRIVPPLLAPAASHDLDSYLASCQYTHVATTTVMQRDLHSAIPHSHQRPGFNNHYMNKNYWLYVWAGILKKSAPEQQIYLAMLQQIKKPHCFVVRLHKSGEAVSCGMAVCIDGLLGVFGIATAPAHRGRGHAQAVVEQLMRWGRIAGTKSAYLQVEQDNKAAISVYEKLAFNYLYTYWYREKHTTLINVVRSS